MTGYRQIIIVLFIFTSSGNVCAQDTMLNQPVTIRDTICTLESAISIIEKHTGLSFSYNTGLIVRETIVRLNAENEPLITVLKRIFNNPSLNFGIVEKHLVIYREPANTTEKPKEDLEMSGSFEITGRIFDKTDKKPIPFTSIYLFGKAIGNISNEQGEFRLKLTKEHLNDTVIISCVGYYPVKEAVSLLINTTKDYFLNPDVIPIQEVIIRKVSPYQLLNTALSRISSNYQQEPAVLTSFYREMVLKGNRYLMVSEAVLEAYKPGYPDLIATDRIKIIKGRKTEDVTRSDTLMLKLKAGLSTVNILDIIRNMPDFLLGEPGNGYTYTFADIVVEGDEDYYAIEFRPVSVKESNIFKGRILIGIKDMAIKWVDFNVDKDKLDQATGMYIIKKPLSVNVKLTGANYRIGYRKTGDRYYLYTIQCETSYRIRERQQISGTVYTSKLEMVVTGIDTLSVDKFSSKETARLTDFFTNQLGEYDEYYWGDFNYITPDKSLEQAVVKMANMKGEPESE